MQSLASLILFFGTGFVVALTSAWAFVRVIEVFRKKAEPEVGCVLRLRAGSGVYRSRLVELGRSVWTLSAPLQRDTYVPLRIGEELVVEAAGRQGAHLFRSQIVAREPSAHHIMIKRPDKVHRVERREHRRWPELAGSAVQLEGEAARLLDLSQGGARIDTAVVAHSGDRVRIDLPWGEAVYGWILSREGRETRVRFEDLVEVRSRKKETAPVV